MPTTTPKGYVYPLETDNATNYPAAAQTTTLLEDARPGISVVTTVARNAYTGTDLWDGRIIWNTTTLQLEKYDLATVTWIAAAASSSVVPATVVAGPPGFGSAPAVGTGTAYARDNHSHGLPSIATYAPLASPALTGTPTAPTQPALTNNTDLSTTQYTDSAVAVEAANRNTAVNNEANARIAGDALLIPKANNNAVLTAVIEASYVTATPPPATMNIYVSTNPTNIAITAAATNNWVFNVASTATATLDSLLAIGQAITVAVEVTQGATAYYCTSINIDGTLQTVNWQGGTAPVAGFASGVDVYMINILKTAAATYRVLASLTQF